ncbi:MAG: FAD-binding protein [Dehalococcoidia bacterium]|nr:FAD-binding protein [Dehalococcoidia bacterium]
MCGMAGAVAGITAQDHGADVLVLDKQPLYGFYTSSRLSGGIFIALRM